ncbi:large ribosomal subunit protein uL2-like [Miscanthus floridulus]|uniref:large ribosomal subunit protein uL2-like n=1 Tax=Miscanthus floridulus TaxID=154761 RepID=UPI003457968E
MYTDQFIYCGRHAKLSNGNVWACTRTSSSTMAAAPCSPSVTFHRFAGSLKAPSSVTMAHSAGTPRDYAVVISHNPDNGASIETPGDYAIIISRNPNNGIGAGQRLPLKEGRNQR